MVERASTLAVQFMVLAPGWSESRPDYKPGQASQDVVGTGIERPPLCRFGSCEKQGGGLLAAVFVC